MGLRNKEDSQGRIRSSHEVLKGGGKKKTDGLGRGGTNELDAGKQSQKSQRGFTGARKERGKALTASNWIQSR